MKKLFTLVLALAMVFAIAAPAMAAWGSPSAGTTGAPFTVEVNAVVPTTDNFGNTYYNTYNNNSALVVGAPLYAMITITVPTKAKLEAQYGKAANADFTGELVLNNLYLLQVVDSTNHFMLSNGTISEKTIVPDTTDTKTYKAVVLVTAKAALPAKVTYTVSYSGYGGMSGGDKLKVGSLTITLPADGAATAYIEHSNGSSLTLNLNTSTGKVEKWVMKYSGTEYEAYQGLFISGSNVYRPGDTLYDSLNTAYTKFTNDLGFTANDTVYFTLANIRANYGLNSSKSAYVEYTGIGTAPVITPTPTVPGAPGTGGNINVPNTGDSISVAGYVMIGLALLATAAVIVRKVRA